MNSLAVELNASVQIINSVSSKGPEDQLKVIEAHSAQISLLAPQVNCCHQVEQGFAGTKKLTDVVEYVLNFLTNLADIIKDFVHERDLTRQLIKSNVTSRNDFGWQYN